MDPGTIYPIRIDVSSSNFPHFDANPDAGEPEAKAGATRIAANLIYMDASHPPWWCFP